MNLNQNILTINLKIIKDNYHYLSELSQGKIASVVKANAYGLGAKQVSRALIEAGCRDFFVSNFDEALKLRWANYTRINIYVFHGINSDQLGKAIDLNIIPVINSLYQFNEYVNYAKEISKILPAILHFDTGMNRLGMEESEIIQISKDKESQKYLDILYIISHLSISEEENNERNITQRNKFLKYSELFPLIKRSLANSSSIFLGKEYHFDMVRPGGALYGINPLKNKENPMKNPVSLKSYILQIRNVKKGEYIGYSNGFKAERDIKVATIPIGYGDGYKRLDNSDSYVIIGKEKAKIVGYVSMDLTIIDVSHIDQSLLSIGTEIEIIGENIHQDILGVMQNTIGYEVLTSLGNRYLRKYVDA